MILKIISLDQKSHVTQRTVSLQSWDPGEYSLEILEALRLF